MSPKIICLSILFALLAALTSTNYNFTPLITHLSSIASIRIPTIHHRQGGHQHHHRHHTDENKPTKTICDDTFPQDFPPPDTNKTSFICVDSNGCCNFTTVQAAVDAVALFSPKRTIIWINNGIYL